MTGAAKTIQADGVLLALEGLVATPTAAGGDGADAALAIIRRAAARREGCPEDTVAKRMARLAAEEPAMLDYSDYLAALNVDYAEFWRQLAEHHERHTTVHEDGLELVKRLARSGRRLYAFSSGTTMATYALLARAGLGTPSGSEYFAGVFGVNTAADLGIMDETMWRIILAYCGLPRDRVAFLCERGAYEAASAVRSGARGAVVLDRGQAEAMTVDGPIISVRRAEEIPAVLTVT